MSEIDPGNACAAFSEDELVELLKIAEIHEDAGGLMMTIANKAGESADHVIEWLPDNWEDKLQDVVDLALRQAYAIAFSSQLGKDGKTINPREALHRAITGISGFVGGMGGPLSDDDAADTGLWAGRIALSHGSVTGMIHSVSPALSRMVSEGLLARATPVIGGAAGAAINTSFTRYYQKMAHVNFRLRRLEKTHPQDQVLACFERIIKLERSRRKDGKKKR